MNKSAVVLSVSEKSGVGIANCERVVDAFEEVLANEFSRKNTGSIIDKVIMLLNYMKSSKFVSK